MKKITLYFILGFGLNSYCQAPGGGITDIDGNTYNSVIIGTQEWTKENLNVSKYSDGTVIPQVTDPTVWASLTTGAWCYYGNNTANGAIYGKLYNWYAVVGIHDNDITTPNKSLSPSGWHVATDAEFTTLTNFLGGADIAGGKLKETGTTYWSTPNVSATNSSGFTGRAGGHRYMNSTFTGFLNFCYFWSSTSYTNTHAWSFGLYYNDGYAYRDGGGLKYYGKFVRFINNTLLDNQSIKSNSFNIYPNPAIDNIVIELGNLTTVSNWSYKITNTLGQEVIKGKISSQQTTINLNDIKSKGMYFVKIYDASSNALETKKLIIN